MTEFKSQAFYEFLSGEKFSAGEHFSLNLHCTHSRIDLLTTLCAGKTILHVGCCDHTPLVDEKREHKVWLHGILTDISTVCLGVDIDEDAVAAVRKYTGLNNFIVADITRSGIKEIEKLTWDIVVFGEVLEHISNPVAFLKDFAVNYGDYANNIVVTVPNARSAQAIGESLRGVEKINTDHRYCFTPYTLSKVLYDAGYCISDLLLTYNKSQSQIKNRIKTAALKAFPLLGEGLMAVATIDTAMK